MRLQPSAQQDICTQVKKLILEESGQNWEVIKSDAPGEDTLDQQSKENKAQRYQRIEKLPLVQKALKVFPGAKMVDVEDQSLDYYGLPKRNGS